MTLDTIKHKNILLRILKDVFSNHALGPFMGFKGGTAAYLFYNLNRFSSDLDFDLLDIGKKDFVFEEVKKILEGYGVLKEAEKKKNRLFFLLYYNEKEPGEQNVKVEINLVDFGSKYEVKSYLGIPMKIMVRGDMAAHKMVAMYEREAQTNRDIFDVCFFLTNDWPVNEEIVEKRTGMPFNNFLRKCINLIEDVSDRNILAGMGEILDEKQKDWVRKHLKTEVLFLLRLKLENMEARNNQL